MTTPVENTPSLQELRARYVRMCIANDLDYTASPQSQMEVTPNDLVKKCIVRLISNVQEATERKALLARGRTKEVRQIYSGLSVNGIADFSDAFVFRLP